MKKKLKILIIPILITILFFLIHAFPYFAPYGISSLVEETNLDFGGRNVLVAPLLKNEKIKGRLTAKENNFGIFLVPFFKFGNGIDTLAFRLKKEGDTKWYYENTYNTKPFAHNDYYPFGFPIIHDSKDKVFDFEIESLAGSVQDGITLIPKKPQAISIFKFSRVELLSFKTLSYFLQKRSLYVLRHVDYLLIAAVFLAALLSSLLVKAFNITVRGIFWYFPFVIKNPKKGFKFTINKIKTVYNNNEKEIFVYFRKFNKRFTSTKFYLTFLNTITKKRIAISLLIFIIAFSYRYSSVLVNQDTLFYSLLGGQGDYDQFIRASTCAPKFCSWILHQNLLIESLILGYFYQLFGFIGGLKTYSNLMIILSSIVATLPYLVLSRKSWFSIGGIIGSLFLATSGFLTTVALNFPPDNGSTFIFSMFFIVYLLTMHYGTIRWLVAFGLTGLFDGMFKAMFLINDLVALALFAPVFFYEKTNKAALPLASQLRIILKRKNIKILFLALLPLLIFLILYSAWEYFVQIKFQAPYFLRGLVETGGSYFKSETLFYNRGTGKAEHDLILQLFYLLISGLVMVKRLVDISDLQIIFLAPIFFGLLIFSFIKSPAKRGWPLIRLGMIFIFSFILTALLVSIKNDYLSIHKTFPGEYISSNWSLKTYISIFLFVQIIFLFIINFRYQAFKLALPILPYVVMLIILSKNAPWVRLLAQVIVWTIILFSFIIDETLTKVKMRYALKRIYLGPILLVLFIAFYTIPKTSDMVVKLYSGINSYRSEVKYLQWVNLELPQNAIILAGGKSDLVNVGENIKKPIVYNSLWLNSLLIYPDRIPGVQPQDFTLLRELSNKDNFNKKRYFVLESDYNLWKVRLAGVGDSAFTTNTKSNVALHAQDFSIKVYKTNQELNKNIFELKLRQSIE